MRLTRFHAILAFIALMLLRVTVGYHFFKEGTDKLKYGFTAEYFLKSAKGPFAPHFHKMLDDENGERKFCLTVDSESGKKRINPELTFLIWEDFLDRATMHYELGDTDLENEIAERRKKLASEIKQARAEQNKQVSTRKLELLRADDEQSILRLRQQKEAAESILQVHKDELTYWLDVNRIELLAFFETQNRVDGFDRDGEGKEKVAVYVDSLRDQVTTIRSDRDKQMSGWAGEVEAIWDSYESQINGLAVDKQKQRAALKLHRPFAQENSMLQWINAIIPWFDTVVGALLILGLFTRLASLAGAAFLVSVIATQPPWIPGTQPTYLYAIELMALIVIFATLAGRMGGLDFFLASKQKTASVNQPATQN